MIMILTNLIPVEKSQKGRETRGFYGTAQNANPYVSEFIRRFIAI